MNLMGRQQNEDVFLPLIKAPFTFLGSYLEFQGKSELT